MRMAIAAGGTEGAEGSDEPTEDSGSDCASPQLRQLLATDMGKVELSVRARNVLFRAEIKTLGDLIRWDRKALLSTHACGEKTIAELEDVLRSYGLSFGTIVPAHVPPHNLSTADGAVTSDAPIANVELDETMRAKLHVRVSEMNFSARAQNALGSVGVEFVGDLVVRRERELLKLKNFGRKTLNEIREKLARLDLHVGMDFPNWTHAAAERTRECEDRDRNSPVANLRRQLANAAKGHALEDELNGILQAVAKARDVEIVDKLFGWSGKGQRTLESVGAEYSVTRERIRQIAAKVAKKLASNAFDTPHLEKALRIVRDLCPATPEALAEALQTAGVTNDRFDLSGLRSACEYLGGDFDLALAHVGSTRIYVKEKSLSQVAGFFRLCRKLTANQGCANFESICDELRIADQHRASFRKIATVDGQCEWLDDEQCWLYVPGSARNRLSNVVAKVLSVCATPTLSELRTAITRSRRLAVAPPGSVLGRFVEKQHLGTVSGNKVTAASDFSDAIEPRSTEAIIVSVLREHGPVLAWDRLRDLCLAEGMNPITFGIYLSASPILARLARGIYSLVGANVPPGLVEDVAAEMASSRKGVEWGWTTRGTLWCAIPRIGANIGSGAVVISTAVSDLADGEWRPTFGGREVEGTIKCSGRFLWGLKRPLSNSGIELDDTCILEFDFGKRTVDLTIGGEELVDIWDSGDIELPIPEPSDTGESEQ